MPPAWPVVRGCWNSTTTTITRGCGQGKVLSLLFKGLFRCVGPLVMSDGCTLEQCVNGSDEVHFYTTKAQG